MITWKTSKADSDLISKITARFLEMMRRIPGGFVVPIAMDVHMDLSATHSNGCPLDLGRLLAAEDDDFAHDVGGIRRHLDRETGELMDCFVPRVACPENLTATEARHLESVP